MAFRKATNFCKIEGILSEIDLKYGSYTDKATGEPVETIGGSIKVLVEQEINGEKVVNEVPVYMFSKKFTKVGKINPAYDAIEKVMKEYVSIASSGDKNVADKVRITSGEIRMNEFIGQNKQLVSQPRVQANFVQRVTGDFKPDARFEIEFMASKIYRQVDGEGVEVEPARLVVEACVPQYTPDNASVMNVDLVPLVATSPRAIEGIESNWEAGSCYRVKGRLNFTSRTESVIEEVDWGEAQERVRTINTHDLLITGGNNTPLDGDYAWEVEDIRAGMAARAAKIEAMKNGEKSTAKQAPAKNSAKGTQDLGF